MSRFPLPFDRLHEAPRRNKADFRGRQQIIFQATGDLAGLRPPCQKRASGPDRFRRNCRAATFGPAEFPHCGEAPDSVLANPLCCHRTPSFAAAGAIQSINTLIPKHLQGTPQLSPSGQTLLGDKCMNRTELGDRACMV
jgi:hypothetical protein